MAFDDLPMAHHAWLTQGFDAADAANCWRSCGSMLEKELTRRSDEIARQRLPWVRVDKEYVFSAEDGEVSLRDLFGGRSQLLIHHFMFPPGWTEGCPGCSSVADG
jgi:predicted dithiol-disulfide oxidoreductase (DUF899 family)